MSAPGAADGKAKARSKSAPAATVRPNGAAPDSPSNKPNGVGLLNGAEHPVKKPAAKSQATILIELAMAGVEYFHTPGGDPFAKVSTGGHFETHALTSKGFRTFLKDRFFERKAAALAGRGMQDAIGYLESVALKGPQVAVFTRVGQHGESFYLDLCNAQWSAVEISKEGWSVNPSPPVRFRRSASMQALPDPVRGELAAEANFRRLINSRDSNELILIKAWLLAAMRPKGPYPILSINGQHGAAKSSVSKALRLLIDPNKAPLRALPKDERDLFIAAENSLIQCLDNVSGVPGWLSDAFCQLSTGGGYATRELHSDGEEKIFNVCCPCILNGIEDLATREDLADRCLFLNLPKIPDAGRITEETLLSNLETWRPGIMGYFLDVLSGAMSNFGSVQLDQLPRMADFAVWSTAAEGPLGLDDGAFMAAYNANREEGNAITLEASPIASHLMQLMEAHRTKKLPPGPGESKPKDFTPRHDGLFRKINEEGDPMNPIWKGTPTQLLDEIEALATDGDIRGKRWPKSARGLSQMLKRLVGNLEKAGFEIVTDRDAGGRWVSITNNQSK